MVAKPYSIKVQNSRALMSEDARLSVLNHVICYVPTEWCSDFVDTSLN